MSKLVVFDLDGTLYQALEHAHKAVNCALTDIGYPLLSIKETRRLLGTTTEEYCDRAIPGYGDRAGFFTRVERYERAQIDRGVTLFDGVLPMLETLEGAGFPMAVCSNGTMDYICRVLGAAGILSRFATVESGAEDSKVCALARVLAQHRGKAVMVGDRIHDFEAASALGIASIAACYGYGAEEEYTLADGLAHCPAEIPKRIKTVL